MEQRGERGKGEGQMIYLGRGIADCIKGFQDEMLAIICPFADK